MSKKENSHLTLFRQKAQAVSAVVEEAESLDQAFDYVLELCGKKEACQLLVSGCGEPLSEKAEDLCETKQQKVIAAPNIKKKDLAALRKRCEEAGFACLDKGLREHLAGIDIGFTLCDGGIADTGTVMLQSNSEETRLATMIAEIHVAAVRKKDIVEDLYAAEKQLDKLMNKTPSYTAFITGASRTADIERVLALGVHGPLEMHILLMEDF